MKNMIYTDDKIKILTSVIGAGSATLEQIGIAALLLFGKMESVSIKSAAESVANGQSAVTRAMKSLEDMGVLAKRRCRENGRFTSYEYVLSPYVENPHMVEPHTETPRMKKPVSDTIHDTDISYIYNKNIDYDDISIISYHDPDDDVIDEKNDDLFLASLSNPITYLDDITPCEKITSQADTVHDTCDCEKAQDAKAQISYDTLTREHQDDTELVRMIADIMNETYASTSPRTRISGQLVATRNVVTQLLKLGKSDIDYVIDCVKNNSRKIRTIKPYLLTTLYNAAISQDSRKVAEKYSDGKSKKKDTGGFPSTINFDLYDRMIEEQSKLFEKLGSGEISWEEFKKQHF